jgi:hypothetical protein
LFFIKKIFKIFPVSEFEVYGIVNYSHIVEYFEIKNMMSPTFVLLAQDSLIFES